jgi:hypothetical protein
MPTKQAKEGNPYSISVHNQVKIGADFMTSVEHLFLCILVPDSRTLRFFMLAKLPS